ncbi:ATP-binding cassette domain-containing protein [Acidaminobacter sp. JC074]|uniref:AAA family ATPase n=1 Tax=Acidaminobacter sp. JC074 TaxID=2530199 RepID=UPI001F0D7950|nr:AAA family ATPase [Acidaminobacter sp. JC074]MCH4886204.1 ATP-binding cassette domain-containing protein [Acidaminobacter sp. JC074]
MLAFDQYIREISLVGVFERDRYPFNLNAVKALDTIKLHPKVTYLVGENGSGKSTLLEAIAVSYGFNPEGGGKNFNFSTEDSHSVLSEHIKITKGIKLPKNGYFLRAESFYNVASNIDKMDREGAGYGAPIIDSYGGKSLHQQSHGESFMSLLLHRFSGNGVYILDEPEAALSPTRQLSMLSRLHELINEGAQFIIATHSPIIMAYPDAVIYSVDDDLKAIDYEETEHYQIMYDFMTCKDVLLHKLLGDENEN